MVMKRPKATMRKRVLKNWIVWMESSRGLAEGIATLLAHYMSRLKRSILGGTSIAIARLMIKDLKGLKLLWWRLWETLSRAILRSGDWSKSWTDTLEPGWTRDLSTQSEGLARWHNHLLNGGQETLSNSMKVFWLRKALKEMQISVKMRR